MSDRTLSMNLEVNVRDLPSKEKAEQLSEAIQDAINTAVFKATGRSFTGMVEVDISPTPKFKPRSEAETKRAIEEGRR